MSEGSQLLYRPAGDLPDFMQEPPHGAEVRLGGHAVKYHLPSFCAGHSQSIQCPAMAQQAAGSAQS